MPEKSQFLAILLIFCLVQIHCVSAAVRSMSKSHNFPQKQVLYKGYSFKEGNLVYAVCDALLSAGKSCMIIQERYPDGKLQRFCNLSLHGVQDNASITDQIYMSTFGHDKVILFWDELGTTTLFRFLVVKLDDCSNGGYAFPDPYMKIYEQLFYNNKIVTYDDTFEIFIKNISLADGANEIESVLTVNSYGFIEKITPNFMKNEKSTVTFISSIGTGRPNKSYVYSKEFGGKNVFTILKPDGSKKVFASFDSNFHIYHSMLNNLITLCLNSSVSCAQYDREGDLKFNATFDEQGVATRDLYNLPDGGFLIALSEYAKSGDTIDFSTVIDYSIVKMNGEGKKIASIHLNDLVNADNMAKAVVSTYVWKNRNEEYCAAVLGQGINQTNLEDEPSDLNIVVNCFTEADMVA